ncbi:bile acid:sodium symporter family protein [Porphyromonas sp.]|uniref:bile acid:sodium symporter family protein n=1 Tax=Porphyromonas sp. TaxID=1924944 RepID=UPI0026DD526E|nr:bile acid:sodium symporter [Porphyromonas sp.]MDO4695456.1 hypothetical protein [Porphyromonas sp.]MDO4770334.1 hypothetical protein [Porphyromonas sp.]
MTNLIDLLLSGVVGLVMFVLGLSLTRQDYLDLVFHPKPILVGLLGQIVMLPLVVFLFVTFLPISSAFKVGFILLSACPGGTTSGIITYLLRGNVAMSLSLTVLNSIISLFTIPAVISLALHFFHMPDMEVVMPMGEMMSHIFLLTIVPVVLGMIVRKMRSQLSLRLQVPLKLVVLLLLAFVFGVKFFAGESHGGAALERSEMVILFPLAVLFNMVGFVAAVLLSSITRLGKDLRLTAAIEIAVQNSSLAMLISGTLLQSQAMLRPSLVYAMTSFWITLLFGFLYKKSVMRELK